MSDKNSETTGEEEEDPDFSIFDNCELSILKDLFHDEESDTNVVQAVLKIKESLDKQNKILKHILDKLKSS